MTTPAAGYEDRALRAALARADARLRRRRAARHALAALAVGLAPVLVAAIWHRIASVPPALWWSAGALLLAGPALAAARSLLGTPRPAEAAAALDRAARLPDTFTTAAWFLRDDAIDSPWVREQRRRADEAAAALDVDRLIPLDPPRGWRRAVTAAIVLCGALLVAPAEWTRREAIDVAGDRQRLDGLRAALDSEAFALAPPDVQARARELVADIEAGLAERREGVAGQADALRQMLADEREARAGASGGDDEAGDRSGAEAGPREERPLSADDQAALEDALARAAREADDLADLLRDSRAADAGTPAEQEPAAEEGADGDASGAAAPTGGEGRAAEAAGTEGGDRSMPGGNLSGPAEDRPDEALGADATDLDVLLQRERLASAAAAAPGEAGDPVEGRTESGASRLRYEAVAGGGPALEAGAQARPAVPWPHRDLVRRYFLERAAPRQKDPS